MSEEVVKKSRVRRSPGGISVSVLLKGHQKPITFECLARRLEGSFMIFYSHGTGGRTVQRSVNTFEIALLEVEEPFVPQFQAQVPQGASMSVTVPQQPQAQPSGPVISTNPMRRALRSGVSQEGFPVSELEDGTVIPAGFIS